MRIKISVKAFLQFLTKKQADSALTQKLQKEVQKAREQKRWRQEYMTLYEKLKDEREAGREEGIKEGIKQGIKEGIKQGIERGELSHLVRAVCKKLQKNMSAAEIADILEEDEQMIGLICDVAAGCTPDYDVEAIVEHLFQRTEKEDIVAH